MIGPGSDKKELRSILYFQKANEISLLCCVSMWNFRADFDWKFFPHSPQGDSTGFVSPSFGWASFKCWFICKKIMRVNLARKVISSVLKTHLRHRAHDVLASQAKECRVCVPVHEYLTTIWGDLFFLSKCKYLLSKPTFVDNALSSSSVPCPRKQPEDFGV